jgi:hypothetical protein
MSSITTRAAKGSPLTHAEVDANFTNLNTDKAETAAPTFTGAVKIAAGSAAAPALTFTGDLNTGIYSPGADQLALSTAGTERLRIDSSGRVGIGTSSPASLFHLNASASGGGAIFANQGYNYATVSQVISSADAIFGGGVIASDVGQEVKKNNADAAHYIKIQSGEGISFHTNITGASGTSVNRGTNERLRIANGGTIHFPSVGTTASAANAFLDSASSPANQLLRSTSSRRYKTDIEDLQDQNADAILGLRPVWYRSLAEADRKDWSWYGLIAEEVAEVEPRLVFWTYLEDAYEEVDDKRQLKADAEMVPDGVQYDRLTVLLLDLVQRQNERIEALEAKVAAMEGS